MRPARSRRWRTLAKATGLLLVGSAAFVAPWRWLAPPTSAFMLLERIREGRAVQQRWVPRSQISADLALAVIAAEDQKFPVHHGFDLDSIVRATRESRDRVRGASTISQQLAKNLFLWPGRSWIRKGIEGYLTLFIEALLPKRRILELYLNVAEFGPGIYGAAAAGDHFFGKPASRLTLGEASLLAAVLPNPKRLSAADPSEYVRGRAAQIRGIARKMGRRTLASL